MYTISEFSKKINVSARALRLYEEKGLIQTPKRAENGYRYYEDELVPRIQNIQKLKRLGFSLIEIKKILVLGEIEFKSSLESKLDLVRKDISLFKEREKEILELLCVTSKIEKGSNINTKERRFFMDAIQDELKTLIEGRSGELTKTHLDFLVRDEQFYNGEDKLEFIQAVKDCVAFAKEKQLTLGPGRGSLGASITMYGLGISQIDPVVHDLLPERLLKNAPDLHIDVEFERGQEFVDYCRERTKNLKYGSINAFKMPLLDIINNVHNTLGERIDYDLISDDSDTVLKDSRNGDIDKIFLLDYSQDTLVMKYEDFFPEYNNRGRLSDYLKGQKIYNFRDLQNIISVWRPNSEEKIKRMYEYKDAKQSHFEYAFLSKELKESLEPNFGHIIYHEDLIRIIHAYSGWSLERCAYFRRNLFRNENFENDLAEFKNLVSKDISDLVVKNAPLTFCRSHIIAFSKLFKKTAILKSLHKDIYYEEIKKWEKKFGYRWDDIGIKIKGVSLLQH